MKNTSFTLFCFVIFILFQYTLCHADISDEAVAILVKAFEHSGDNPGIIHSGTAEFHSATIITYQGTDQSYQKQLAASSAALHQDIKVLILGNNSFGMTENAKKCRCLMDIKTKNKQVIRTISKGSPNQNDSYMVFVWDPNQNLLERYQGTRDNHWILPFQQFGRLGKTAAYISVIFAKLYPDTFSFPEDVVNKIKNETGKTNVSFSCEIIGEDVYDDGARAKIIEVKREVQSGIRIEEKYHIDIERGYIQKY